jgi:hypothetical protein
MDEMVRSLVALMDKRIMAIYPFDAWTAVIKLRDIRIILPKRRTRRTDIREELAGIASM